MELSLPVKATLGVGSAASAAAGGIYLTSSSEGSSTENQTEDTKDSDQNSTPSNKPEKDIPVTDPKTGSLYYVSEEFKKIKLEEENKLGYQFSIFLISPLHDKKTWDANLEALSKDNQKDERFKNLTEGKNKNNPKSLSSLCSSLYKEKESDSFFTIVTGRETSTPVLKENLKNNFWKYCSYLGQAPVLISSENIHSPSKIKEKYHQYFSSTEDAKNNKLWEFKEAWYKQLPETEKLEKSDFEKYKTSKGTALNEGNAFSLKKFCKAAIEENINGQQVKPLTVLYYCSHERILFQDWFNADGISEKTN